METTTTNYILIQCGSEIRTAFDLNDRKEVGLQEMVPILMGPQNPETQPFEIRTYGRHCVKNHLKSRQQCPNFRWSGLQIVVLQPTLKKLDQLKSNLQKVWISNLSGF